MPDNQSKKLDQVLNVVTDLGAKVTNLDKRVTAIDAKIDAVHGEQKKGFHALDAKIDAVHDGLDVKIDAVHDEQKKGFQSVEVSLEEIRGDLKVHDAYQKPAFEHISGLLTLEDRTARLGEQVSELRRLVMAH